MPEIFDGGISVIKSNTKCLVLQLIDFLYIKKGNKNVFHFCLNNAYLKKTPDIFFDVELSYFDFQKVINHINYE